MVVLKRNIYKQVLLIANLADFPTFKQILALREIPVFTL